MALWPECASQAPRCRRGKGAQYGDNILPGSPACACLPVGRGGELHKNSIQNEWNLTKNGADVKPKRPKDRKEGFRPVLEITIIE